jgi:MFS family permease
MAVMFLQGLVLSAFFAGHTLTQVLGGYTSDLFGAEKAMTVSMVGWATLTGITPLAVKPFSNAHKLYTRALARCKLQSVGLAHPVARSVAELVEALASSSRSAT